MSDLSELFKAPLSNSFSLNNSTLSAATLSSRTSPPPRQEWQLGQLQASLRKGVRREVKADAMQEELRAFFQLQKEVATKRMLVIGGVTLFLFLGSDISVSILFTLVLLITAEVLPSLVLAFSEPVLNSNLRRLQHLIYCTIFYSLLKWATGTSTKTIDWPMTYLAIVASSARGIITFYDSFLTLSTRSMIAEGVRQKKILGKLILFPKYVIYRAAMLFGIAKHLIITIALVAFGTGLLFYYFNRFTFDCFQPSCILLTVPIFLALQLFLDFISFVNLTFTQDLTFSRFIKDKVPLFLTLLRLQYSPSNRLVQLECLKSVFIKLCQAGNFLTTQTYKSLIYTTYMDIFNQYAAAELERANADLMAIVLKIKVNDKTIAQQKSLLKDLLVYFRKAAAFLSSEWQASRAINVLASLSYLFLIIERTESQGAQEEVRVSGRVLSLVRGVKQRLGECIQRSSLCSYTRGELTSVYNSLCREEFFIENG